MEKDLQRKCVEYARSIGLMCYSINPTNYKMRTFGTIHNLPDIRIENYNAYFEFKAYEYRKAHKDRQEKQAKRRKELTKAGAKAYKCDSFEKFKTILEYLRRENG